MRHGEQVGNNQLGDMKHEEESQREGQEQRYEESCHKESEKSL